MKYMPSINIKTQDKKGGKKKNEKANIEGGKHKNNMKIYLIQIYIFFDKYTLYKYLLSSISNMTHCIVSPFVYDRSSLYMQVQHTQ